MRGTCAPEVEPINPGVDGATSLLGNDAQARP